MRRLNEALVCLLWPALIAAVLPEGGSHHRTVLDVSSSSSSSSATRRSFLQRRHGAAAAAATTAETVTMEMTNYLGVQYIAPITLGNQALSAVYDTGSFDIMALSAGCTVCKSSLTAYNNTTSSTFHSGGQNLATHEYVSGHVLAKQDFETVRVGNETSPLLATEMPFWQVVDTNIEIWTKDRAQFTVIVGLGHADTVPTTDGTHSKQASLLEKVNAQRFAICLERGYSNPGWLTVNPQMSAATQALYKTVPVVGHNHWSARMPSVAVPGWADELCGGKCVAIVDSGTSMIGIPSPALVQMAALIENIATDCSNIEELPDINLRLGEHSFTLPPSAYVLKVSSTISDGTVFASCIPAFMQIDMFNEEDNADVWILGMPFLRNQYTVFDREGPSLHIAGQGEGCQPAKEEVAPSSVNPNLVNPAGLAKRKLPSPPTLADVRAAMRPLWARGNGTRVKL